MLAQAPVSRPASSAAGSRAAGETDRGSATVWAALAITAVLTLAAGVVDLGSAVHTRHRAEAAADLAALAAAARAAAGQDAACATARDVANAMRARVVSCRLDGWNALVEASAQRSWALLADTDASARAHAGPVPAGAASP